MRGGDPHDSERILAHGNHVGLRAWAYFRRLAFSAFIGEVAPADASRLERFALPYVFKPRLSLGDAFAAAIFMLLRIFMGSLLFAFWGTGTLLAWSAIGNRFWRVAALLPLLLLFPILFGLLMSGISAMANLFIRRRT